jgi:hypothetical protein
VKNEFSQWGEMDLILNFDTSGKREVDQLFRQKLNVRMNWK